MAKVITRKHLGNIRLGETNVMRCGMSATIIRYGGSHDIDVKFEDGTVAVHKGYDEFVKGTIGNPNYLKNLRTGEKRLMNCGMMATIIRYGGSHDIDVEFENGYIAKSKVYDDFLRGRIGNTDRSPNNRLGETKTMYCGLKATIIRYGGATDIDVKFEDGAIVKHKTYRRFQSLHIGHPVRRRKKQLENARTGETRRMRGGMNATIIRYGGCQDIDVEFDDGYIARKKTYGNFCSGNIGHPSTLKKI